MGDAVNISGIQISLGFNYYSRMQVMTDVQLRNALMHEIVSNLVRFALHLLGYNVVSHFHLHVYLQSYGWTCFQCGLWCGFFFFFSKDSTLHSLKEEFYFCIHTYFCRVVLLACIFSFTLSVSSLRPLVIADLECLQ